MSSNLIPASELPPGTSVWASELTADGRASLHRFLTDHAKHYSGHVTELERWIIQGVLDRFGESINEGRAPEYVLKADASKDGNEQVLRVSPADVLCEVIVTPEV